MLYTGLTGYVKTGTGVGAVTIAHIANFSLELSKDIIEDVSFGNTYKEKVPSIKDWTASADGSVDFDADSGQKALYDSFEAGTLLTYAFGLTADTYFEGEAYIESMSIDNSAEGKAEISISISGSNGVTLTLPA